MICQSAEELSLMVLTKMQKTSEQYLNQKGKYNLHFFHLQRLCNPCSCSCWTTIILSMVYHFHFDRLDCGCCMMMVSMASCPPQNCQVRVKRRESGSRIRVRFVYDESSRRGQGRPRPSRGEVDWVQRQRREVLTPCVGHNSSGDGRQR